MVHGVLQDVSVIIGGVGPAAHFQAWREHQQAGSLQALQSLEGDGGAGGGGAGSDSGCWLVDRGGGVYVCAFAWKKIPTFPFLPLFLLWGTKQMMFLWPRSLKKAMMISIPAEKVGELEKW